MQLSFESHVVQWRGPAPFYWAPVPEQLVPEVSQIAAALTYGWGVMYVMVTIGNTTWKTSLMPKAGGYLVPLKAAIRQEQNIALGDAVEITLDFDI